MYPLLLEATLPGLLPSTKDPQQQISGEEMHSDLNPPLRNCEGRGRKDTLETFVCHRCCHQNLFAAVSMHFHLRENIVCGRIIP